MEMLVNITQLVSQGRAGLWCSHLTLESGGVSNELR